MIALEHELANSAFKSRGWGVDIDPSQENAAPGMLLAAVLHSGDQTGDRLISDIANHLRSQGYRVGGVIQSNIMQPGQCRCDMVLEELTGGQEIQISQNLGNQSRGCRLDAAALEHVVGLVETSVRNGLDMLVLNKFGNQEAEGKGLRNAIALAVDAGIPVLVGLSRTNIDAWNSFCGGEGQLLEPHTAEIERWLVSSFEAARHSRRVPSSEHDISV